PEICIHVIGRIPDTASRLRLQTGSYISVDSLRCLNRTPETLWRMLCLVLHLQLDPGPDLEREGSPQALPQIVQCCAPLTQDQESSLSPPACWLTPWYSPSVEVTY